VSTTAATARDNVLVRVRSYGGIAFDDDWARNVLALCERTINAGLRSIVATTTVTTTASQSLYFLRTSFTAALYDAIDILQITAIDGSGTYELRRCTIQDLFGYDSDWFHTTTTDRFLWYIQLGRDLLFLYPSRTAATSISVKYSKQTTLLATDGTNMDTSDDDVPIVEDLLEIVLLAVLRLTDHIQAKIPQLTEKLGSETEARE
jgi:hypothetical protein